MSAKPTPILTLTRAEYDAIDAVNWSTLKYIDDSPLHYRHHLANPKESTDAMRLGRVIHTAVFEPERVSEDYAVWALGRRAGKDWDAFCESHQGRDVITQEQFFGALQVAAAVRSYPAAKRLLKKGTPEATIVWTDRETGIRCKARLDWVTARQVADLKSTNDIEARHFGRTFSSMRCHGQFGFQSLGLQALGLKRRFRVIAVEQAPPFDVAVYTVSDNDLYAGEELARKCLDTLAECRRTRHWPGRYEKALPIDLPPWCWPEGDQEERRELMRIEGLI